MHLILYDINMNRVGHIFEWTSLLWREEIRDLGAFSLQLPLTEETKNIIKKWRYVKKSDSPTAMIILTVKVSDNMLQATGYSASYIFTRRISTTVISNKVATTAILQLFNAMDPWPQLLADDFGSQSTAVYPYQISGKSLFEYFHDITEATNMGFRVAIYETNLFLEIINISTTVDDKYSPNYGGNFSVNYTTSDCDYFNVALVAGEGTGSNRVLVWAGDTASTGYNRREMYIDARQEQKQSDETALEYQTRLETLGLKKLAEQIVTEDLQIKINDDKIELGNLVDVNVEQFGITITAPVTAIETKIQRGIKTFIATVGDAVRIRRYR